MKGDAVIEVCWASVVWCLEGVSEECELCSFVYGRPVELLELRCDVCAALEAESDSGCRVLNGLQSSGELLVDPVVEGFPIVQFACDKCVSDGFSGAGQEPFEDFPEHLQGVEAGCGDGVDLDSHVEFAVNDSAEVSGVDGGY